MLFDHDAKVSGDSARFADFLAAGGQQPWGGLLPKDWVWLGYRSVTHPAGRRLGAMLTAMPFSSDRARAGPMLRLPYDPVRQIAEDHTIGNLADAGLPALVPGRHLDGKLGCPAGAGLRDSRAGDCCLLCSDRLSPVAEDRPHYYVRNFGRRIRRCAGQLAVLAGPVSVSRLTLHHGATALHARQADSRIPLTPKIGARRSAAIYGHSERPGERPPPPSCPMCYGGLAYHRRDNLPGQIRA